MRRILMVAVLALVAMACEPDVPENEGMTPGTGAPVSDQPDTAEVRMQ